MAYHSDLSRDYSSTVLVDVAAEGRRGPLRVLAASEVWAVERGAPAIDDQLCWRIWAGTCLDLSVPSIADMLHFCEALG